MRSVNRNAPSVKGKRILLLFPHVVIATGALHYTLRLAERLVQEGSTVGILALRVEPAAFKFPAGVDVISIEGPLTSKLNYWLLFPLWQHRLNRAISDWKPEVIVPQVFPANWWGWLYKRQYPGVKLAWCCHEPSAFIHSHDWINGLNPCWKRLFAKVLRPFLRKIDIRLARQADRVIANSKYTAGNFETVYGRPSDGVAYPGIDFHLFNIDEKPRDFALITVAHLTRYKRVDFLLRVFAKIKENHPGLVYHIVGKGDDAENLQDLAMKLGIEGSVLFHGKMGHSELAALNRRMTLFLHGGVNETFGMAPLEAIACGTPVVVHRSGGPMEFVNEKCGRLIASLCVEDWAREISDYLDILVADEGFPGRVRECARDFDWQRTLTPAITILGGLTTNA